MALATYNDLVTSIGRWLHRSDLATVAPDLIALAEARIYQGSADIQFPTDPLRLSTMEQVVSGDLTLPTLAQPAGLIEIRKIEVGTGNEAKVLDYGSRERIFDLQQSYARRPTDYSIESTNIIFGPAPDVSYPYRMVYFSRFPALSATITSNWLLTNAPNIYLYGALVEASPYMNNDPRLLTWYRLFAAALRAAQTADDRLRSAGGALRMRPA